MTPSQHARSVLPRIAIAVCALLILIVSAAYIFSYMEMRRAQRFLRDVMDVESSQSGTDVLQELFQRYGDRFTPIGYTPCSYVFLFNNRAISRLKLARPTEFGAALTFRDGHASIVAIDFDIGGKSVRPGIAITKTFDKDNNQQMSYSYTDYGSKGRIIFVHMNSPSPAQNDLVISAINLKCLTKVGGCNARELAPSLYAAAEGKAREPAADHP